VSGTGEIRQSKFAPVGTRGNPGDALEQTPEKGRILIADRPADFLNRLVGPFQPSFGFLDAHMLHIGNGRITGCFRKTALEASAVAVWTTYACAAEVFPTHGFFEATRKIYWIAMSAPIDLRRTKSDIIKSSGLTQKSAEG